MIRMKINRLVQTIIILLNKGTVTAKYLSDRFGVSTRTIYRDIDELTLCGIPIYTNKGQGGGISLLEGHNLNQTFSSCLNKQNISRTQEELNDDRRQEASEEQRIKLVSKIWECFIEDIGFDRELIKEEILSSWKWCKEQGVTLYDFDISLLMKPEEKKQYVLKHLPEYNTDEFTEFCDIIENLNLDISIYDKNAKLKYIINYNDSFDDLYPEVGYFKDVSEKQIGTNSTSLALAENKPFMVVGSEHYKNVFHEYSCAAAPFYDKNNEIAGTINASFVHTSVNNDTLNIVYSIARLYETLILKRTSYEKHEKSGSKNTSYSTNLFTFDDIVGNSDAIKKAKIIAKKASKVDSSVVIYGESGSGKELFAQAIHSASKRKNKPFLAINCGAIPKDLIESELFGYEAGSFTGAVKGGKKGLLEHASGGTLFLDEIESMPIAVQTKLLRAFSASSIARIGGYEAIPIDIRVISASKANLRKLIAEGSFREDLYYRINVIEINIPPLRERKEDTKMILEQYMKKIMLKNNININRIDDKFYKCLEAYEWPGNIRQLINVVERSVVLSENGVIDELYLPSKIKESYITSK